MKATRESAVLVPVYRDAHGELKIVLVRRSEGIVHGGQIALPGGKREPGDRTARETALREVREEIGIGAEAIRIIAQLPVEKTLSTGFSISPFLGRIKPPAVWHHAEQEVAEVLEIRLGSLLQTDAHGEALEYLPGWPAPRRIAFYRIGRHRLWGATYRILRPLVTRLTAGEWEL